MKLLVTLHILSAGFQSQNLGENIRFPWLRKGQLWNQISRVLFEFCSAYIYSFERFFSQLFNGVLLDRIYSFWNLAKNVEKTVKKSQKFYFPGPAKKYLKKPQGFNKQNRTPKRPPFQQKNMQLQFLLMNLLEHF
jgi:hypothetical protein